MQSLCLDHVLTQFSIDREKKSQTDLDFPCTLLFVELYSFKGHDGCSYDCVEHM